ncbi:MAG: hypothetical protein K0R17_2116 [Rariglobus sp.]|jgi:hypothetical protein|nr:hypothetical protein [Rariglobus sp.]
MKTLLALVTLAIGFVTCPLSAADFSGTIIWTTRFDITDPEMKRQMEDAKARMSDPEMQAQMKAAQEAMNSPEMQAMIKANPQMKQMMEKQMQAMSKPGGMGDLFPKGFTLQIKGPRSLMKTDGGVGAGDILTLADQKISYQIDRAARTYRKIPADTVKDAPEGKFKVTPTKETAKVLGYTCRKYLVETTENEAKLTWSIWATDDIKGLDASALRRLRFGQSSGPDFLSKIDGVPLKIDATTPQMKIFMEATGVKSEALPDSLFELPGGFKEVAAQ